MSDKLEEVKLKRENAKLNLSGIYMRLRSIINRAKNIFSNKKTELKSDNNISVMNEPLKPDSIIETKPELAKDVFATFNEVIKSDKNNSGSLSDVYLALSDIAKAQPELAKDVFATFNEALKSDKNDYNSLWNAYFVLSDVIKAQPELAKDVFATFNEAIKSDKNNYNSLRNAYLALGDVAKAKPELAKDVFATLNEALKSDKNDSDSLGNAYFVLDNIAKAQPELAKDIVAILNEDLKSDKNNSGSLKDAYSVLSDIAKAQPELAKDVFAILNEDLKSDKNDSDSLKDAYSVLSDIAKAQPELAKDVFATFNETLKSDKNDFVSLRWAYLALGEVAKAQPELAKDVFATFNEDLKSDKNDSDSLWMAYLALVEVAKAQPELAKDIVAILNEDLKSDKNDSDSLRWAYLTLGDVANAQPELAKDIFAILNEDLKSDKNDSDSLRWTFKALGDVAKAQPELAKDVFATFNEAIKSDKNDSDSLRWTFEALGEVAKAQPELAKDVFATLNEALKSDKNYSNSLWMAYSVLSDVIEAQPELAKDVFATFNEALKSDKNDSDSLEMAYSVLNDVIKAQPELAKDVFATFNEALKSDKNYSDSLEMAYSVLSDVIKAQPELAKDVFATFNEAIKSDKNDSDSLEMAYSKLGNIAKAQPELAKDIVNTIISARNHIEKTCLLSLCMKNCRPEDFPEANTEQKQELQAAHIMRFSTKEEINYLYYHSSMDKIAQIKSSAQQRCMNVMMSQLGKEQKLDKSEVIDYRKNPENKTYKDNADWLIPASFKAAELFGCYFPSYIKQTEGHLNTHDSVYWLPEDMGKEKNQSFVSFVQRNLIYEANGEKKCRNLAEMEMIAQNWKYLKPDDEKLKYKDILAICRSRKYKDQEYENFAAEAAKWGVTESQYKDFEDIYAAGLKVPEPFDSSKRFEFGNYCGRFLPRDDIRTGFFGKHTDCCQHFDGVGKECAISTIKDPYSQLFVIENKESGKIVAGSWVWENTEGTHRDVCFDNIEAIGEFNKHPMLNRIYDMAGRYLTEEANCRKVTIGMGYQDAETSKYKVVDKIPLPTQYDNKYSDAKGTQVLLAQNPKAEPLDKSQESVRFVREACFLDWDAMDKISEQCFPDGDERLQSPERLTGLALVDKDKGVVGYCLYDKDERSIYDMAVLPEYRTDKNASSRKLFAETIKKIKEIGGEWSAELRDKTTYRYMEIMQQRGLVSFETHGLDHEMSDGSKVYSVTFKVNDTPTSNNNLQQNMYRSGGRR